MMAAFQRHVLLLLCRGHVVRPARPVLAAASASRRAVACFQRACYEDAVPLRRGGPLSADVDSFRRGTRGAGAETALFLLLIVAHLPEAALPRATRTS